MPAFHRGHNVIVLVRLGFDADLSRQKLFPSHFTKKTGNMKNERVVRKPVTNVQIDEIITTTTTHEPEFASHAEAEQSAYNRLKAQG